MMANLISPCISKQLSTHSMSLLYTVSSQVQLNQFQMTHHLNQTQPQITSPTPGQSASTSASFLQSLAEISHSRIERLKKTILGDYYYVPKNRFKVAYKQKILSYLQAKHMTIMTELEEQTPKKFTDFDVNYAENPEFRNLRQMKQSVLKLKTHIEAAEDLVKQQNIGLKQLKANFLNQAAYEFSRQRRTAIGWGLIIGSAICGTIYRRGSNIRKIAVFVTVGHLLGQVSYHWNIDKYFDTVYPVFEEDALEFVELEQKQKIKESVRKSDGQMIE